MSLLKKDPSLRVAANDPHLVSLGGGRLSVAVTIHYIPIGDTTIGSSPQCSITLNGTGVCPTHCTIYRSEENEVTLVPERDARTLIDGTKVSQETNLIQGAMITIGNSNYLRFNNPAEAEMMRSAMGSNERISMPQIDFTQTTSATSPSSQSQYNSGNNGNEGKEIRASCDAQQSREIGHFDTSIIPLSTAQSSPPTLKTSNVSLNNVGKVHNHIAHIDINGLQCPKVFTADLVTVSMPAKDVLGQKYASFAKNLVENNRSEKHNMNSSMSCNNQPQDSINHYNNNIKISHQNSGGSNYVNIPNSSNFIQNSTGIKNTASGFNEFSLNATSAAAPNIVTEYMTKVNNTSSNASALKHQLNHVNPSAYDRYPKPGTYGELQIFPMNGVNTEINKTQSGLYESSPQRRPLKKVNSCENECLEDMLQKCAEYADRQQQQQQHHSHQSQNNITSSPIVQNRIKTNGSLPREKKSPFYHEQQAIHSSNNSSNNSTSVGGTNNTNNTSNNVNKKLLPNGYISSGYENVRLVNNHRVEISEQLTASGNVLNTASVASPSNAPVSPKTGYENVVLGKYVPQSPRTRIRTNCMSPKKENSFGNAYGSAAKVPPPVPNSKPVLKQNEYEQLIRTFEEKLKLELQAIEESSRYKPPIAAKPKLALAEHASIKRTNKNINNLTLNLEQQQQQLQIISSQNISHPSQKPTPAPRMLPTGCNISENVSSLQRIAAILQEAVALESTVAKTTPKTTNDANKMDGNIENLTQLKYKRKELFQRAQSLKDEIAELQKQEDEVLQELDLENSLISGELHAVAATVAGLRQELLILQNKIRRLEAQRNATRVMEENQQAKLKQSIEMKQDQVKKLKAMLKSKPNNDCLKDEINKVSESLENDRKTFEDLEFQYLEEESEWHAYREELHVEEKGLLLKIEEKQLELQHLEKQELANQSNANIDTKTLKNNLIALMNDFHECEKQLKSVESSIHNITGQLSISFTSDEGERVVSDKSPISSPPPPVPLGAGVMSQSLFGSAELLCPKRSTEDIMSKSMNENMFYNNKIELPSTHAPLTSTPNRAQLQLVHIDDTDLSVDTSELLSKSTPADQAIVVSTKIKRCNQPDEERVIFNLSLGSDDFKVNLLEKRIPSQDDIDRISKVTLDAPISTRGASNKIFDSIKEIERNRQLLLAQQGHHVIEHERQKITDLKKKSHDEARAQYLSKLSEDDHAKPTLETSDSMRATFVKEMEEESMRLTAANKENEASVQHNEVQEKQEKQPLQVRDQKTPESSNQQRHSQPEFESNIAPQRPESRSSPRPLSEGNSELSCDDLLSECSNYKPNLEQNHNSCISNSNRGNEDMTAKRSSINSSETKSIGSASGMGAANASTTTNPASSERKRALPKHQRPLTRYLPIFSPDLNLKHHIESAGHQIALCPHVFVDAYSCRGYLHKLGATFHGWARRWFVLDRQRNAFIYYADKSERKPRGGAYFSTIDEVYLDHLNASKSGRPHCTFIVKTKKRSYHLQAASDAAARIWIDAIITGAQGNLDY